MKNTSQVIKRESDNGLKWLIFHKQLCAHDKKRLYLPKEVANSLGQLTDGQVKVIFLADVYYEMIGVTRRNNNTIVELSEGWPAFAKKHKLEVGKIYTIGAVTGHDLITVAAKGGPYAWNTLREAAGKGNGTNATGSYSKVKKEVVSDDDETRDQY